MHKLLEDRDWLEHQYATQSIEQIAGIIGVARETVRLRFVRFGIATRKSWDVISKMKKTEEHKRNIGHAQTERWKAHPATDEFKLKISETQRARLANAKGKRRRIFVPGIGGDFDYRITAARMAGRKLTSEDIVHHRDDDPTNGRPDNLQITTRSEHGRIHAQTRARDTKGRFC